MVGKQNILLHVASGNREERDVDTDFILNHCTRSVMGFCSGGQDNSIETKWSNTLMASTCTILRLKTKVCVCTRAYLYISEV